MTDKEIIEKLENVRYHLPAGEHKAVIDDAIECINQQREEIDKLTKWNKIKIEEMRQERQEMLTRNKKFRADIIEKNEKMFLEAEAQIRPQAIKEFAEKLKEDIRYRIDETGDFELYEVFQDIDNLVKEMGADNG